MILPEIQLTKLAVADAKRCLQWNYSTLYNNAEKAYNEGWDFFECQCSRDFRQRVLSIIHRYMSVNNVRVYDNIIYLFSDNTLILILIPKEEYLPI